MKLNARLGSLLLFLVTVLAAGCVSPNSGPNLIPVGVARVDISPTNAVRLMGYAARAQLPAPTNISQRIHARAIAIGGGTEAALLLTIDNCILPGAVTQEIRERLAQRFSIRPDGIALSVTHTHSAPCLRGAAPNIFAADMTAEDIRQIDAYTEFLIGRLEMAATMALADRRPATVSWGQGSVGFAKNRRTAGGPVDHALPLLRVTAPDGTVRAIFVSYACHCTTLSGELNAVHGDWAGVAAQALERDHPGAVALVAVGAGADSNPDPRGTIALAERHGESLAREAGRLLATPLTDITNAPTCRLQTIALPFQPHFTRAQWEARATSSGIVGYHARKWIDRLDRGEAPSPTLPYPVQTWRFGDQLAMVFLGGEVVVDYSLRLKRELDTSRLWVNAYANDVPCYIPSRRILGEGGYEAETSLWYYDRPQQLAPETEDLIIRAVRDQLPAAFQIDERQAGHPPARSPAEAKAAFRLRPGMEIGLVASEPLIESPVAIDFGADGRLWVCEMRDYPSGLDGNGQPGGRVKVLTDTDGDGQFDAAQIVADALPFPTGLMAWHGGVIVCAAPDVWIVQPARDSQRDGAPSSASGKSQRPLTPAAAGAITIRTPDGWHATQLLTGFATHNFQARVNGLRWGLDGWVYGSGGLFGGKITVTQSGQTYDCSNRDFRFKPDTGEFEPLAGVSQQGHVRNDFGEWFGNDNGSLIWQFPLPDRYARRNPHVSPPTARLFLPAGQGEDIGRVFPASRTLQRFNDPGAANRLTSACGPEIYRDELLGSEFYGNAFVCEPVHNLVRRAVLVPNGISYTTHRAADEATSEFLASTDNWFRPVEVRTGPDGALWVVDMYRFVVEHPRWIPAERLKDLDPRAGANLGRIWRVYPSGQKPRPIRNLAALAPAQLAEVIGSPNGAERDLAHRRLLDSAGQSGSSSAAHAGSGALKRIARSSRLPACRAQALTVLSQLGMLGQSDWAMGLRDAHREVRRVAVELAESGRVADSDPARTGDRVPEPLLARVDDPDATVRFQLALTLGEFDDPAAGRTLARLVQQDLASPWHRSAVLSAALAAPAAFAAAIANESEPAWDQLREDALNSFVAADATDALAAWLETTWSRPQSQDGRTAEALRLLAALEGKPEVSAAIINRFPKAAAILAELRHSLATSAFTLVLDTAQPERIRQAAVELLARAAAGDPGRQRELVSLLEGDLPPAVLQAVFQGLGRTESSTLPAALLSRWAQRPPLQRGELIAILLGRENWTRELLSGVTAGTVLAAEFSPAQRQLLRQHSSAAVRDQALALFPVNASGRGEIIARYSAALPAAGDSTLGAGHFDRLCASCHLLRGHGYAVGPDLAPFRGKPSADFLTAILDPNAAIEPRFVAWTAELKDGRSLTGIVRDESATGLKLLQPSGQSETLRRSEIASLSPHALSLMPEGLDRSLTPADLADLIAWIKSAPAALGSATAAQISEARRQFAALNPVGVTAIESPYAPLPYPSWLGTLPLHYCRQTDGQSRLKLRFEVPGTLPDTVLFRFAAGMGFISQPSGTFTLRLNGTPVLNFNVTLDDTTWRSADGRAVLRYLVRENGGQDSNGVLELEAAAGLLKPGAINVLEFTGSAKDSQRWFGVYAVGG